MNKSGRIWMNGKMVPFKDAKVHVLTHALHYSTAVFEGIRCYNTPDGPAIFRLSDHIDRLFRSAKMYSMSIPYSKRQISDAIIKTAKANKLKDCYIRPLVYYGYGLGVTPTNSKVDVSISCWEWKTARRGTGYRCKVSSWIRIDSRAQPMRAKATSNYANAVLARTEALEDGYDEAIMLNSAGKVAEASTENIFIIKDGSITTPSMSSGILEGITRDSVIRIIEKDGGHVSETDIDREDMYVADEVFMTGTAAEIKPVIQVDRAKIANGAPGRVALAIQKSFSDVTHGKDDRFLSWLTFI